MRACISKTGKKEMGNEMIAIGKSSRESVFFCFCFGFVAFAAPTRRLISVVSPTVVQKSGSSWTNCPQNNSQCVHLHLDGCWAKPGPATTKQTSKQVKNTKLKTREKRGHVRLGSSVCASRLRPSDGHNLLMTPMRLAR